MAYRSINGLDSTPIPLPTTAHGEVAKLLPMLRDAGHVDGLPVLPLGRHVLRAPICIDGESFSVCSCGWVREFIYTAPAVCAVDEAESEYQIALWCAEKRITAAAARGERDAQALYRAMAAERR